MPIPLLQDKPKMYILIYDLEINDITSSQIFCLVVSGVHVCQVALLTPNTAILAVRNE